MLPSRITIASLFLITGSIFAGTGANGLPPAPLEKVSFMRQVAPLLREHCMGCHDARIHKSNYQMTTFERLVKGGDRGGAVTPGKPDESSLFTLIAGEEEPRMPPKDTAGPLPPHQVDLIKRWIAEGAVFDGARPDADLMPQLRALWTPPSPPEKYPHPHPVRAIAFTPDGKRLVVGGHHELLLWDWTQQVLAARIHTRAERTSALLLLPDNSTLAVAGGRPGLEGTLRLYQLPTPPSSGKTARIDGLSPASGILLRELLQSDDEVLCLAVSPDGKLLAAGGTDRAIRVWKWHDAKVEPLQTIEQHADWVQSLAFDAGGQRLYSASRDKTVKVWNFAKIASELTFPDHQSPVSSLAPLPDGDQVFSGGDDNQIRIVAKPPEGRQRPRTIGGFRGGVTRILFRPGTSHLIAASGEGTIRVLNVGDGRPISQLSGHSDAVYALAVSSDGKYAASGGWNGEIRVWDLGQGRLISVFQASPGLKETRE